MTVLRFGPHDAARCRFAISPLYEVQMAVRLLLGRRSAPLYDDWVATRSLRAPAGALALLGTVQTVRGYTPDFVAPLPARRAATFAEEIRRVRAMPTEHIAAELHRTLEVADAKRAADLAPLIADPAGALQRVADAIEAVWEAILEPDWPRLRRVMDDDIDYRGGKLTSQGLAGLFEELHPSLHWAQNRLICAHRRDPDRDLGGTGLLLVPSVLVWPALMIYADHPMLVYPARNVGAVWRACSTTPDRLASLLGRTRARLLTELDPAATSSDLARAHDLALATVAGHLAALRDGGLAVSRRVGRRVYYRRSELGQAVLEASL